jgi:hypothetical protein
MRSTLAMVFCALACAPAWAAVNENATTPTSAPAWAAVNENATTPTSAPQIVLPNDGDEYSSLVARAVAEDHSIDFRALRFAWLKSNAHKGGHADETALESNLFDAARGGNDVRVREAAVKLLSVNYINMFAHAVLRQSCAKLHDDPCVQQHHFIEFGLLTSITQSGDEKTCKTGWEVVAVREEYFVVHMLGDTPADQALINGADGPCDELNATGPDGKPQAFYFRIDAVLKDEMSMLKH